MLLDGQSTPSLPLTCQSLRFVSCTLATKASPTVTWVTWPSTITFVESSPQTPLHWPHPRFTPRNLTPRTEQSGRLLTARTAVREGRLRSEAGVSGRHPHGHPMLLSLPASVGDKQDEHCWQHRPLHPTRPEACHWHASPHADG